MSVYLDALSVDAHSSDERLELATEILASGTGVVVFAERIALRTTPTCLVCEVIDSEPASHRCVNEYEVMVENAQKTLESESIRKCLPAIPRSWRVVEDDGTGLVELWRAP